MHMSTDVRWAVVKVCVCVYVYTQSERCPLTCVDVGMIMCPYTYLCRGHDVSVRSGAVPLLSKLELCSNTQS